MLAYLSDTEYTKIAKYYNVYFLLHSKTESSIH